MAAEHAALGLNLRAQQTVASTNEPQRILEALDGVFNELGKEAERIFDLRHMARRKPPSGNKRVGGTLEQAIKVFKLVEGSLSQIKF